MTPARRPETKETRYAFYFCWSCLPFAITGIPCWRSREDAMEGHLNAIDGFKMLLVIHPKPEALR